MGFIGDAADQASARGTPPTVHSRPADAAGHLVDLSSLAAVRAFVEQHGGALGLAPDAVDDLVLATNELATNVVRHGGGEGRLWVWSDAEVVWCQMSDHGGGMRDPGETGESPSPPTALTGRGLWMIRRMTLRMDIETGPNGTTVTIAIAR